MGEAEAIDVFQAVAGDPVDADMGEPDGGDRGRQRVLHRQPECEQRAGCERAVDRAVEQGADPWPLPDTPRS
jgi:hypothetical protein